MESGTLLVNRIGKMRLPLNIPTIIIIHYPTLEKAKEIKMTTEKVGKVVTTYVWVKRNGKMCYTGTLDHADYDSEYQQILRAGEDPHKYGYATKNNR